MSVAAIQYILAALQLLPTLISAGTTVEAAVSGLSAQLKLFQSENRDPNAAEWQALNAQLLAALQALQKAASGA